MQVISHLVLCELLVITVEQLTVKKVVHEPFHASEPQLKTWIATNV